MKFASKLASSILGICLILALTPYASAVNPKTGAACKKLNSISMFQNKKYTCIKSGKKLVWDKGVLVKDPQKEAAQAKAAEDAQKAAEQAKKDAEAKAIADAKATAEAKAAADLKAAADKISLENSTFDINHLYPRVVYERSRAEIAKAVADGNSASIKPIYHIGANVEVAQVDEAKVDLNDAIKLWSKYFSAQDVEVIWYSFADKDWAGNKFNDLTGYMVSNSSIPSCSASYCANGMAVSNFKLPQIRYVFEHGIQSTGRTDWHKSTIVHEYTHLAQAYFTNQNAQKMVYWINEGIAQFYGEAVSFAKFDFAKKTRSALHANYWPAAANSFFLKDFGVSDLPTILKQRNEANTVKIMQHLEYKIPNADESGLGYLFGGYAAEVLVALYGNEKLVEYLQTFHDSEDFRGNFEKIFGIQLNDFYKKLTPYFADMADELKNPN